VVPVGRAVAWAVTWAWNHSVVLVWRYLVVAPVRWTWQSIVTPTGRWIRQSVLQPVGHTVGRVLATLGLR
jgi:hypothetical protein